MADVVGVVGVFRDVDRVDLRERRRLVPQRGQERGDVGAVAVQLDVDALAVVTDLAAQPQPGGQPVDERDGSRPPARSRSRRP
ncbi:hypothetical protein ACG83_38370 [Frankia sp. R43]|nr:hypothetical protein ACG83_38370 [Frankia sp. R43]